MRASIGSLVCGMAVLLSLGSAQANQNTEPLVSKLAGLLKAEGALVLPPVGKQYAANEWDVQVELVELKDDVETSLNRLARERVEKILSAWNNNGYEDAGSIAGFNGGDVKVLFKSSYEDKGIKGYLLRSLVAPASRAQVSALLSGGDLSSSYLHFQIYDIGSEIVGDELLIIKPLFSDKAIVITYSYVHA